MSRPRTGELLTRAALPLLLAFLGTWGAWAIALDQYPELSDSMLDDSVGLYEAIRAGSGGHAFANMGDRPFLGYLPATLLYFVFGPSMELLRLTMLAQYLAAVYLAYSIGRHAAGRGAGLLAAVMVGTFPPVFGWGRLGYMDVGVGLLLLLGLRVLLGCDLGRAGCGARLGLVSGLGLLTKVAFPIFAIPPLCWALIFRLRRLRHAAMLGLAALVALATAGWWYALNWTLVVTNIGMSSAVGGPAAVEGTLGARLLGALAGTADRLRAYTWDVDGAVWMLALAALGSVLAWRSRAIAGSTLALLSLSLWVSLATLLFFQEYRRYVIPVYMVSGVLAGLTLHAVVARLGGARLAALASGLLSTVLLGYFVAVNLGLPVHVRPGGNYLVSGPRIDGLGMLSPDRRPLTAFPGLVESLRRKGWRCLVVYPAGELREKQQYREGLHLLRDSRPLPLTSDLGEYVRERPRRACVVVVAGDSALYSWGHHPQAETGQHELCLAHAWFLEVRAPREIARWGPSPLGLTYLLYEIDPATLDRKPPASSACRLEQVGWDAVVNARLRAQKASLRR